MRDGLIPEYNLSYKEFVSSKWIRYSSPVFKKGDPGNFDERVVASPFVLERDGGKFFLYYMGQNRDRNWAIGLANSRDLEHWEKRDMVLTQSMIKWGEKPDGPFVSSKDGIYYLFYEATSSPHWLYRIQKKVNSRGLGFVRNMKFVKKIWDLYLFPNLPQAAVHAYNRSIGFATSVDGIRWNENDKNPIFTKEEQNLWESMGVFAPKIYRVNGQYWMYYSATDGKKVCSGLAFSSDLRGWERHKSNPILKAGGKSAWDERCAEVISVIKLADGYVLFYEGENSMNCYGVGIAYSADLMKWEKFVGNPVINAGKKGSFDDKILVAPHAAVKDGRLYLFYSGFDSNGEGNIGLAALDK
ncbi:MAG: hypothetical protein HZB79_01265 [Deltaproteobacteria bacterium]|nr:hypothetical protein [Deltaproteobacteria bacterium]